MDENKAQRHRGVSRETFDGGVYMNILSRLSVKSICSYKSVSKFWHSMFSDKYFAKKQLEQSRKNPTFILYPSAGRLMKLKLYSMRPGGFELFALNTLNPAKRWHEDRMNMISSFNGLICCVTHISREDMGNELWDVQIWICNPCTGETLLLPQGTPSYKRKPIVGVTYASNTSDYKVFRIFCAGKKIPEEIVHTEMCFEKGRYFRGNWFAMDYQCEVYSSITGSWKIIGPMPLMCGCLCPYRSSHAFVGEKLFWLVYLREAVGILSVDSEGRVEDVKLPNYGARSTDCSYCTYLNVFQGSLSLVIVRYGHKTIEVWVWKEENKEWSKLRTGEDIALPFNENVLAVTTLKSQILFVTETCYWKYDVDTDEWETETGPSSGFVSPSVLPFTESLVPCNGSVML
ncbi:unnamed protein product [Cochlearia groenlandica]